MRQGIGVEGVTSEIGVLGKGQFLVECNLLRRGLKERFGASEEDVDSAIRRAIEVGAIKESKKDGKVYIELIRLGDRLFAIMQENK